MSRCLLVAASLAAGITGASAAELRGTITSIDFAKAAITLANGMTFAKIDQAGGLDGWREGQGDVRACWQSKRCLAGRRRTIAGQSPHPALAAGVHDSQFGSLARSIPWYSRTTLRYGSPMARPWYRYRLIAEREAPAASAARGLKGARPAARGRTPVTANRGQSLIAALSFG